MKRSFDYPSQKVELGQFIAANQPCLAHYKGACVIVLTGDDLPPAKPLSCNRLQFTLALAHFNLTEAVENYVANADNFVKAWYRETKSFKSDNPMLLGAAEALGLAGSIRDVFTFARTMPET